MATVMGRTRWAAWVTVLVEGCTRLGIPVVAGGPVAITSGSHGDRPHCIYRGFCLQGCKVGAKQSTLISHVPDAIRHGAEIRANSMVARVDLGGDGRVTGVTYFDHAGRERRQKAKLVIVSGYAIETPRLLLNSATAGFEQGLANSSGTVGRYIMAQAGNVILGRFAEPVRMYKAPPAHALTEAFYETDPSRDFARGFSIQTVGPLPIAFAKQMMVAKGAWGWGMRDVMMDYNHWAALGLLGEILPWPENRVTLAPETDRLGLPVAHVEFELHDNDQKLIEFGKNTVMEVMRAAGAEEVVQEARYAHLIGGARMGKDPAYFSRRWLGTDARHRQSLHLRRIDLSHAGLGKSRADHPGDGSPHRRLPHHAWGGCRRIPSQAPCRPPGALRAFAFANGGARRAPAQIAHSQG